MSVQIYKMGTSASIADIVRNLRYANENKGYGINTGITTTFP